MNARYYDPEIARFISPDPVHFTEKNPFSFNRYAYANNNPLKFVDPDGRDGLFAASWARMMVGDTSYQLWDPHPESHGRLADWVGGRTAPKCNAFVWDMLTFGGDPPPRMFDGRIPTTSDWMQGKVEGYRRLSPSELPHLGDVVLDKGHMGLYVPFSGGEPGTISRIPSFVLAKFAVN